MARIFLLAAFVGALAALLGLGTVDLVEVPSQAAQIETTGVAGSTTERWVVEARDRVAATGEGLEPVPAGIAPLLDARLAGLAVATMKVRNANGEVIGVASRIAAHEHDPLTRAVWWTFVVGPRGTLAAWLPDQSAPGDGRLLGGTRSFEGASGQFAEEALADGGYRLRLMRVER